MSATGSRTRTAYTNAKPRMKPRVVCGFLYFSPICLKMVSTLGVCGVCFLLRYWTWPWLYLGFPSLLRHKELVSFKYANNLLSSYKWGGILLASCITERKVKYGTWPLGINNLNRWKDTSRDNSCYIKAILYAKCYPRGLIESKSNMVQSLKEFHCPFQ